MADALAAVPPRFDVFDREGKPAFSLGDGVPRIAAGHNAVNWVDSRSGETRPSTIADVELFSRICQQLECIDMIGIPVMPQDCPDPRATLLYGVRAVIQNSTKPLFFSTDSARVNRGVIELCRAAFKGDFKRQVYGITQLSSTSPLYWEEGVLEASSTRWRPGVPIALLPEPIAGISAPYTLAGLLTMHNTECLSGIAMIQRLAPGTKVMYGSSWTTSNMADRRGPCRLHGNHAVPDRRRPACAVLQGALPHHRAQLGQPQPRRAERLGEDLQHLLLGGRRATTWW